MFLGAESQQKLRFLEKKVGGQINWLRGLEVTQKSIIDDKGLNPYAVL